MKCLKKKIYALLLLCRNKYAESARLPLLFLSPLLQDFGLSSSINIQQFPLAGMEICHEQWNVDGKISVCPPSQQNNLDFFFLIVTCIIKAAQTDKGRSLSSLASRPK